MAKKKGRERQTKATSPKRPVGKAPVKERRPEKGVTKEPEVTREATKAPPEKAKKASKTTIARRWKPTFRSL